MEQGQKYSLNSVDWQKIYVNFMTFSSPIVIMYLSAVLAVIDLPQHIFSFNDLVPNSFLLGMMVKQVIDSLLDIFRKWSAN